MATPKVTTAERVVHTVATKLDADPLDLPQLYETIDPDALNACIRALTEGELSFSYAGVEVTVDASGTIQVTDPSSHTAGAGAGDATASG